MGISIKTETNKLMNQKDRDKKVKELYDIYSSFDAKWISVYTCKSCGARKKVNGKTCVDCNGVGYVK